MGDNSKTWFFLFRILILLAAIFSLQSQKWVNLLLSIFVFVIVMLPSIGSKKFIYEYPGILESFILIFIYLSIFLPEIISLNSWWVDQVLRFVLSIIVVLIGFFLIFIINREKHATMSMAPSFMALFSFSFALGMGLLWELAKFLLDIYFGTALETISVRVLMWDLIVYTAGAFMASTLGYIHIKFFEDSFVKRILLRFISKNRKLFASLASPADYVEELVKQGESEEIEFKSSIRTNMYTNQHDRRIEHSLLKTIVAFLNSNGGTLLIGISDAGEILGLNADNFKNDDKARLHLTTLIKNHIGNDFAFLIKSEIITISEKNIMKIECKKSIKKVFLKMNGDEEFYIRSGPSSVQLRGSKLIDYVSFRFKRR